MQNRLKLKTLPFCFLAVGAVALSGMAFKPGAWYASIAKPFWTPPNLVFPVAWTILYILIAVAGAILFSQPDRTQKLLWVMQLGFNGLWSWLFFGRHWVLPGFLDMLLLLATIAWLVRRVSDSRIAAWLLAPYLVWVAYASTLNLGIYLLNPH